MDEAPFWRRKRLEDLSKTEWEQLCDGCARCCLVRLRDDDSGEAVDTNVACRLLDRASCRCMRYAERLTLVRDCVSLTPSNVGRLAWMPKSCAYRRLAEGRDLAWWHPLVSGSPETVHEAGVSVRGRTVREQDVSEEDLLDHVVTWPQEDEGNDDVEG